MPNFTFEDSQHDLVEAPLLANVKQHLSQLSTQTTSMKRRRDVELVAARVLSPLSLTETEANIDRPVDDGEFLFLFKPKGCEGDDFGRLLGANQNKPPQLIK